MLDVLFLQVGEYHDIFEIDDHKWQSTEERVHQGLECEGSKWHDQTLVQSKRCDKRGIMDRVFRETNLMIARAKFEFAHNFRTKESVNEVVDVR